MDNVRFGSDMVAGMKNSSKDWIAVILALAMAFTAFLALTIMALWYLTIIGRISEWVLGLISVL